jgi:hypothetical protein
MAYTTIDDPSVYHQTDLFTGDGSGQSLTFDGNSDLQPDWIWGTQIDEDGGARFMFDSTRGATKRLKTNGDTEEQTRSGVTTFDSDGYAMGAHADSNGNNEPIVVWAWKANGGTTATNNDGSYTSTVQANTTAGFSIVKYGDASSFSSSSPATVGHGLGAVPKMIIIKNLDSARDWGVHHASNGAGKIIYLNLTNAVADSTGFDNGTLPTSSVFTVNSLNVANGNNLEYIAYCFAEVKGYSKISSYTGNGNADGPMVFCGFKPAWVLIKETGATRNWTMADSKSQTAGNGGVTNSFQPNTTATKDANERMDWLSDGFKIRTSSTTWNTSGGNFIYMAFAEHPFVSSKGVPTTAR